MRDTISIRARAAQVALLLALAMPLTACETKLLTVQIDDLAIGSVDGIWLWQQTAAGGYERVCRIDFLGTEQTARGEELLYIQSCLHDRPGLELRARIERVAGNPTTAIVDLWYMRWEDAGRYRGSAFNAAGESGLSASSVDL